ncbi:hypothetical protein B0H10DRAFT_1989157 [Mycena sp. CBHHK59/15]|nr:hypothetical protein B0H10DRAFT_1989157 [Mycena sp. CBHHK59/15]
MGMASRAVRGPRDAKKNAEGIPNSKQSLRLRLQGDDLGRPLVRAMEREEGGAGHRCRGCSAGAEGVARLPLWRGHGRRGHGELLPLGKVDVGDGRRLGAVQDGLFVGGGQHERGDGGHGRRRGREGRARRGRAVGHGKGESAAVGAAEAGRGRGGGGGCGTPGSRGRGDDEAGMRAAWGHGGTKVAAGAHRREALGSFGWGEWAGGGAPADGGREGREDDVRGVARRGRIWAGKEGHAYRERKKK